MVAASFGLGGRSVYHRGSPDLVGTASGVFEWVSDWLSLDSGLTAPVATLLASSGVIIAASIAFWNGEKTRREERDKWAESRQQEIERREEEKTKWEESKQRETVRSLRDRYFNITELLSGNSNYAQREAAVYSLVALSDDWASLYGNGTEAAVREQQTCLNVIVGQLRDPFPDRDDKDDHEKSRKRSELIVFKQRVQGVITQRYRPSSSSGQGEWSHIDLDLSFCHLYKPNFSGCAFAANVLFTSADVTGDAYFGRAIFTGYTSFTGITFTGNTNFWHATFGRTTDFSGADFTGSTNFRGADFTGSTDFSGATFTGSTDFRGAKFTRNPDFIGDNFIDFTKATFDGDTHFIGATFTGHISFIRVTFTGNAHFRGAKFTGNTNFLGATFTGNPHFRETEDQLPDQQTHEGRRITSTTLSFDGPSQFTQLPNFTGAVLSTCPTLTDGSDPRDFFVGAIFLDEQDAEG